MVITGNWPAGALSCRSLTWTFFFTWRQDSKNLGAETLELVKGQIQDIYDIKASYKARPGAKGRELYSTY